MRGSSIISAWCTSLPAICCARYALSPRHFIFSFFHCCHSHPFHPFSHSLSHEVASGSTLGTEIKAVIDQGQIVKSETTVALLRNAMAGKSGPFLIDGFPRSLENLEAFEAEMGPAAFMLFLEVSEDEMETRLLKRGATSGLSLIHI